MCNRVDALSNSLAELAEEARSLKAEVGAVNKTGLLAENCSGGSRRWPATFRSWRRRRRLLGPR
jgi:hypothetical protein